MGSLTDTMAAQLAALCPPDLAAHLGRVGTAARVRALRIRAGLSRVEMAQLLGLNDAWVADLETRDGELASTLSLFKALELAALLGVPLHELGNGPPGAGERNARRDLRELIRGGARDESSLRQTLKAHT